MPGEPASTLVSAPVRGRGRPATVTAKGLADVALGLWEKHGYSEISLGSVAEAAGVNTRTLLRYFSSKSDIVWRELDTSFGDLRDALESTPGHISLISRLRQGIVASMRAGEDVSHDDNRRRLRIISRTPELRANTSPPFIAWRNVLRDFACIHIGARPGDLTPEVVASSVQAATMVALVWWAEHSQGPPEEVVDLALRELEAGFAAS